MSQPLILALHTLPPAPLGEQLDAASDCGFDGVAFWASQVRSELEAGRSLASLRTHAEERGLVAAQLEVLTQWGAGEEARAVADAEALHHLEMASALGAEAVLAVTLQPVPVDPTAAAAGFARLCDQAAEHGVAVHLEFLPWTGIGTLESACEVARAAGRDNGGILIDSWHWFRSGGTLEALRRTPAELIRAIQINDAPRQAEANVIDETMHRRLLPGEGDSGVASFVQALDEMGVEAPLHIEVFSDDIQALGVSEAARRLSTSLRSFLDEARSGA